MKNRRNMIVAFLLCACLIVGVGYAALTDTLDVIGDTVLSFEAAKDEINEDVYFVETLDVDNCGAVVSISDNDKIAVTVTDDNSKMAVKGDTASFKAVVANDSLVDVVLTFTHTASAYIEMYAVNDAGEHEMGYTVTIPAGEEVTLSFVLEMLQNVPDTGINETGSFFVTITATAQ